MNKQRIASLSKILGELQVLQEKLGDIQSEEQDYYDNMPENLQEGEKGEKSNDAISNLDTANSSIEDVINSIQEIIDNQ
jgi:flagellar biosynthesis chaperone FliJ